jgi:hypothetical protein
VGAPPQNALFECIVRSQQPPSLRATGSRECAPDDEAIHLVAGLDPAGSARQILAMRFEILGEISSIETFATGSGIREIARLRRIHVAELHWYEAAGIGRKEFKIKHLL